MDESITLTLPEPLMRKLRVCAGPATNFIGAETVTVRNPFQ